jgi:hypothetical protein
MERVAGSLSAAITLERHEMPITIDDFAQFRIFHGEIAKLVLTRNDPGIGQKPANFLEALVESLELLSDGVLHGGGL